MANGFEWLSLEYWDALKGLQCSKVLCNKLGVFDILTGFTDNDPVRKCFLYFTELFQTETQYFSPTLCPFAFCRQSFFPCLFSRSRLLPTEVHVSESDSRQGVPLLYFLPGFKITQLTTSVSNDSLIQAGSKETGRVSGCVFGREKEKEST